MWYRGRFALMADGGGHHEVGHENTANHKQDKKNGSKKWNISWEKRIFAHGTIKNKKISFLNL